MMITNENPVMMNLQHYHDTVKTEKIVLLERAAPKQARTNDAYGDWKDP